MRKGLLGLGLALAAAAFALIGRDKVRMRPAPAEPRRASARLEDLVRAPVVTRARAGSLWLDPVGVMCRVPAQFAAAATGGAHFASVMRLQLRAPQPVAAAETASWVAHEAVDLRAANDADIAAQLAALSPGMASIVKSLRAGNFRRKPERPARLRMAA
jgi:hypothetical protein